MGKHWGGGDHWEFTQLPQEKSDSVFNYYFFVIVVLSFVELKRDFSQVFIVFAGLEPKSFKNLFPFWEDRADVAKINQTVG